MKFGILKHFSHDFASGQIKEQKIEHFSVQSINKNKKVNVTDFLDIFSLLDRKNATLPLFSASSVARFCGLRALKSVVVALSVNLADLKTNKFGQFSRRLVKNQLKSCRKSLYKKNFVIILSLAANSYFPELLAAGDIVLCWILLRRRVPHLIVLLKILCHLHQL